MKNQSLDLSRRKLLFGALQGSGLILLSGCEKMFNSLQQNKKVVSLLDSAEELTLLRQAVSALTNVQTVYYADQVNAQAQETATVRERLTAMSAPGPRYSPISLRVTP